jgi:hypothetical protein
LLDELPVPVGPKLRLEDFAGQQDGQIGRLRRNLLEGLLFGPLDVLEHFLAVGFGLLMGLLEEVPAGLFGLTPGLFEHLVDFLLALGQFLLVLGQQRLGLLVVALGLGDLVGDRLLPLLQGADNRPPGILPQDDQQDQKHDGRPESQVRLPTVQGIQAFDRPGFRRVGLSPSGTTPPEHPDPATQHQGQQERNYPC